MTGTAPPQLSSWIARLGPFGRSRPDTFSCVTGAAEPFELRSWLRASVAEYRFNPLGVYQPTGVGESWPLTASNGEELTARLREGGHLSPLPSEPAALANVLEVSMVAHLLQLVDLVNGLDATKGSERGYPDLEFTGALLGGRHWAADVKVAMRKRTKRKPPTTTQSRITLYTGNTYFAWPQLKWPGTLRPFGEYAGHLDILIIYTFDPDLPQRVRDTEVLVHEPWRIASRARSSGTREYIGAVNDLERLREGRGEFETEAAFYKYWQNFNFKISKGIQNQLRKMLGSEERHD